MLCPNSETYFLCRPIVRSNSRFCKERHTRAWIFPVAHSKPSPSNPSILLFRMPFAALSQILRWFCPLPWPVHIRPKLPQTSPGDDRHPRAILLEEARAGPVEEACGTPQLPVRTAHLPRNGNRDDRRRQARRGPVEHRARFLLGIPGFGPSSRATALVNGDIGLGPRIVTVADKSGALPLTAALPTLAFANPKSISFTPLFVSMMFPGFRSR